MTMKYLVIAGPSADSTSGLHNLDKDIEHTTLKAFDYYDQLEKKHKLEHYVRMDGPPGSVLIFTVESAEEFAELRRADPLNAMMGDNVKVIPLAHPSHAREFMTKVKKDKEMARSLAAK